jgi:hypothetical protein
MNELTALSKKRLSANGSSLIDTPDVKLAVSAWAKPMGIWTVGAFHTKRIAGAAWHRHRAAV